MWYHEKPREHRTAAVHQFVVHSTALHLRKMFHAVGLPKVRGIERKKATLHI